MHAFRDTSDRAFPRMHCLPRVVLAMADQHDPDTVGPSSPLFGFCSSDVVSAIPHGSKGVPPRASTTQHSTAQHGSSSDHVTDQQTVFGTNGEEQGASTRPPTANAPPGWFQPAVSPAYTAYVQPQRPDALHRFSAHHYVEQPRAKTQRSPFAAEGPGETFRPPLSDCSPLGAAR